MSKTRIICTVGPASDNETIIRKMIENGMNVARFNFSHGSHEDQRIRFERIDRIRKEMNVPVAMLMDTKGPEIRLRDFENGKVILTDGSTFVLTTKEVVGNEKRASISYKNLYKDVKAGTTILINDGIVELKVTDVKEVSDDEKNIICTVIHGGKISNRKAINVPSIHISMPYLSEVDKADLEFAVSMGYEYIAASFVREAKDVEDIKMFLAERNYFPKIISKIENQEGVDNLDEIIEISEGIMVARGDMGVEIPFEKVPDIQKEMIRKTVEAGKIVITATNMLESMCENARPTRAEVNDVANAVYDGTTAIMLSGESAAGKFPVEAVQTMERIAREVEQSDKCQIYYPTDSSTAQVMADSAVEIADKLGADAILALTLSGSTAHRISLNRPDMKLIACCTNVRVAYELSLSYGVETQIIEKLNDENALYKHAVEVCKQNGRLKSGDEVVLVAGLPLEHSGTTNMIRILTIE